MDGTDQALHVRLVTWDDEPPVGGQGVYARELRRALGGRGHRVSTTAGHGPRAIPYPKVTGRGHLDMSLALHLHPRQLLDDDPDLVHVSGGPGGVQLLRSLPVPVVYTAHHTYRQAHRRAGPARSAGSLEARSYRRAARVAAVSASTADAVLALGVPHRRVVVISPGVEVDSEGTVDQVVGRPERQPGTMLFVGRLRQEKRPLDAVSAMRAVLDHYPDARGRLIGTGPLAQEVAVAAADHPRLEVLGHVDDAEIVRQYRQASVVLMPSAYEGLGLVALEAMGQGAAVVGYDVTGLHHTIGRAGLLVPFGDTARLADAATSLLRDPHARSQLAAEALAMVRWERSWAGAAASFDQLYHEVLAAG